jgi:hypothetical protein
MKKNIMYAFKNKAIRELYNASDAISNLAHGKTTPRELLNGLTDHVIRDLRNIETSYQDLPTYVGDAKTMQKQLENMGLYKSTKEVGIFDDLGSGGLLYNYSLGRVGASKDVKAVESEKLPKPSSYKELI